MKQRGPADVRLYSHLRGCPIIEDAGVHLTEE